MCEFKRSQYLKEFEEFGRALDNFLITVAEEVGIYKLLNLLTKGINNLCKIKKNFLGS